MEKTGVREISRMTGYSPATVSNVLNNKPGVSRKAIDAVIEAARELGIAHAEPARKVVFVAARRSGLFVDQEDYNTAVIEGARREVEARGFSLAFHSVDLADSARAAAQVDELFADPTIAVLLYAAEMLETDFRLFDAFADRIVLIEGVSELGSFEGVVTANEASSFAAATYLVRRGHTSVGYLASRERLRPYVLRERGYRRALGACDLEYDNALRVSLPASIEDARRGVLAWLRTSPKLPSAFFCDCDRIAVGAMRAFADAGISVPLDVSLMGFDGVMAANFVSPQLTTVYVPKAEIGSLAAKKLIDGMASPRELACTTLVGTSIAERGTVRTL